MAFQRPFLISLRREDSQSPWGFRMTAGGTDFQTQHTVQQVLEGSQAEKAGLHEGDEVIQVGRVNIQSLNQREVQEVISHCRNRIEMFIIREDLLRSRKENEPPVVKAVVHSSYNSPFQLYSTENVADTLALQTQVLTEGADSPKTRFEHLGPQSPPVVIQSDVLRFVKEEEQRGYVNNSPVHSLSNPIAPPRKKPAPPAPPPKPSVRFQDPPATTIDVTDYRNISDAQYQQEQYRIQQQRYQTQKTSYQTNSEQNYQLKGQIERDYNQQQPWEQSKLIQNDNYQSQTQQQPARVPFQSRENYASSYNQEQRATTAQYQQNQPQTRPAHQQNTNNSFTSQQTISVQQKQYHLQEEQQQHSSHEDHIYLQEQQRIKAREEELRLQKYHQELHRQQEEVRRIEELKQQRNQQEQLRQQQFRQQREEEQIRQQQLKAQQEEQQRQQHKQLGKRKIPSVRTKSSYEIHVGSMTKTGDRVGMTSTSRLGPDTPAMGSPNVTRRGGGAPMWPPKNSSVRELPRTGFSPNLTHERGTKKFMWPPAKEEGEGDEQQHMSRPPTPTGGGVANAWHPTESSNVRSLPFTRSPTPTRRTGDLVWPPPHTLQRESPKHSPRVIRRKTGSFDDYIYQHASINVPPSYRTPPGTQHVEIVYEDDL